jgi:DNA-binding CsgD family transcriptional regulator
MRRNPGADARVGSVWPFVGRDEELANIADARADGCCGVVVCAEAGIGKSRLGREALATAEQTGAMTEWVQATRSAGLIPLGACAGLLPEEVPSGQAFRLLQTTVQSLHERANGRPIVVGVDDAQWLDPVSATLVLQLATGGDAFVVATVRVGEPCPDAVVSLWKDAGARRFDLGGLGDDEIRGLIETALEGPVEEEVARWILDRSGGSPMFARELVNGALSAGNLEWNRGLWRLSRPLSIAASLVALVADRMDELPVDHRVALELLALSEPLQIDEIARLTSYDAAAEVEAKGLIVVAPDSGDVRLAHPLYGEALRASLPALRSRGMRVRLAEALQERERLTPEDTVRVVRLLLDAHVPIPSALLVQGADAANVAGDPILAGVLARRAIDGGAGLPAALALGRSLASSGLFRDAEETLAAVEPEAAGHPLALDYLDERARVLFWGLGRVRGARALLERARSWSHDRAWSWQLLGVSMPSAVVDDLPGAIRAVRAALADPALDDDTRRVLEPRYALALFYSGAWNEAQAVARRCRPLVPVRDYPGLVGLGAFRLAGVESGADWSALEPELTQIFVEGVRRHDHEAAAQGALGIGQLAFMRGRFRDAVRWLAEAELHFEHEDAFGTVAEVLVLQVGIAFLTGDPDGVARTIARLRAMDDHTRLRPLSRPVYLARAYNWAACMRDGAVAANGFLTAAGLFAAATPGLAAKLAYDALVAGAPATQVSDVLAGLAERSNASLIDAYAAHAAALAGGDGDGLLLVADTFEKIGALRYAMTAAVHAARTFLDDGRQDSARRAASRARELHVPGQGTDPPTIDGIDGARVGLTSREGQIVALARTGSSNAEIAARLALSVRTVETHLYRAMHKLDVRDRRDL